MQPIHSTAANPYNRVILNAKSHGTHYQFDFTDLVSTVIKVSQEVKSPKKLWMRMSAGEYLQDLNARIESSHVTVQAKDYRDEYMGTKCSSRIVLGWRNVYLRFSHSDGRYVYDYEFPIMRKVGFNCPCLPLLFWGWNVRVDRNSVRSGVLGQSVSEGMMSCKVTSVHRKAKVVTGLLLAAVTTVALGSPQVLAYFSM